ncbi:septum formation inhibitor Maf [Pusillimonas sp. T2]|uniref:Maf family protein n=1 Tax=Pusillimonas sp. T2 TaxID=1548123 RepID=UPI000B9D2107|nr:Maf family protein [Pusillimonas sp. T2]OXR48546.1 septum formation inhibitor Maf [Pusillimonas sp. T2]
MSIYLASASPRRHEILLQMGVAHDILIVPAPPGDDEPQLPGESPEAYVLRTAHEKADRAIQWITTAKLPQKPVLTADTTVSIEGRVLGKPSSLDDARHMLECLSGKTHQVQTVVTLTAGARREERISTTTVTFSPLSSTEIQAYCTSTEPWGKAGGYGIQGKASMFIQRIAGSYSGVMGLPVFETAQLLKAHGLLTDPVVVQE